MALAAWICMSTRQHNKAPKEYPLRTRFFILFYSFIYLFILFILSITFTFQLSGQAVVTGVFPSLPPVVALVDMILIAQRVQRSHRWSIVTRVTRYQVYVKKIHTRYFEILRNVRFSNITCMCADGSHPTSYPGRFSRSVQLSTRYSGILSTKLHHRVVRNASCGVHCSNPIARLWWSRRRWK